MHLTQDKDDLLITEMATNNAKEHYLELNASALLRLIDKALELRGDPLQKFLLYASQECNLMGLTPTATAIENTRRRLSEKLPETE